MDGTIYRRSVGVTSKTANAFQRLKAQGDYVVFSTGRTTPSIDSEFGNLFYDGYVGGNGSQVMFHGRPILNVTLNEELVDQIVTCACLDGRELVLEGEKDIYSDSVNSRNEFFDYSFYKSILGNRLKGVNTKGRRVNKITIFLGGDPFNPIYYKSILNQVKCIVHEKVCVEIGLRFCSKASGAALLLRNLDIAPERCYAFGDSKNDLEILDFVGHGVAMGDAPEEVKEHAQMVTDTVEEDGVFHALNQLGIWDKK